MPLRTLQVKLFVTANMAYVTACNVSLILTLFTFMFTLFIAGFAVSSTPLFYTVLVAVSLTSAVVLFTYLASVATFSAAHSGAFLDKPIMPEGLVMSPEASMQFVADRVHAFTEGKEERMVTMYLQAGSHHRHTDESDLAPDPAYES